MEAQYNNFGEVLCIIGQVISNGKKGLIKKCGHYGIMHYDPQDCMQGITGSFNVAHLNNPCLLQVLYDTFLGYTMSQYSPICTRLDSQVSLGDYVSAL
jgi:hypothetical protein